MARPQYQCIERQAAGLLAGAWLLILHVTGRYADNGA